ncbi:hypothetical protein K0T92_01715 [Paenibacillus oenotherae]|uniref:Nucleotidyl transferase AbiEii/AbiGii toxin family protein n=1 Tax=Paenibacillus oenotherae TaxID=1435645 RepID=A0ABS7D0T2_9BACL|nr:hypothetical protein [Paenibacillus oenotherae]MBW7473458.1 hypothetical protein [Paenibacillus oenotherae]
MDRNEHVIRALAIIADAAAGMDAAWLVGGSAGLQLRGLNLEQPPRDLDIYADEQDAVNLHVALRNYATDVQQESVSPIYRSLLSHYIIEGVHVELVGGFVVSSGNNRYEVDIRGVLAPFQLPVECDGRRVGVVPLAHEMWFNILRSRADRVDLIVEEVRAQPGLHLDAFGAIEGRNALSMELVKQTHERIGLGETRG